MTTELKTQRTAWLARTLCLGLVCLGLMRMAWGQNAPTIAWVSPPAWLQTERSQTPLRPGTVLEGASWISTGRGGKAAIQIGQDLVELQENSLWEWQGQRDGSTGNSLQGGVRVSVAPSNGRPVTKNAAAWLYADGNWKLRMDAGDNGRTADGIVAFLRNAGYPVSAPVRLDTDEPIHWYFWLSGFASLEAANMVGTEMRAFSPGILEAVAENTAAPTPTPEPSPDTEYPTSVEPAESSRSAKPLAPTAMARSPLVKPAKPTVATPVLAKAPAPHVAVASAAKKKASPVLRKKPSPPKRVACPRNRHCPAPKKHK